MQYPTDFPLESRAAVAAEKLRAGKDFDNIRENRPRMDHLQAELRRYILRPFIVFVREACKLGHKEVWQVDRIEEAAMEFLRLSTIDAEYDKGHGVIGRRWTDNWGGNLEPEVKRQFERSDEWRQFQDALLEVAEDHAARAELEVSNSEPTLDLASGPGRITAIMAYTKRWSCSEASLARKAVVDPADLSKWKKGGLPAASNKKRRIEAILRNNEPPIPAVTTSTDL